ncbi:hypothetical protein [Antarcticirhabdus aurantiaca]|uniref:Uncharacterized protein n=1 Tax=Antarcticirhabdus aurantiaca TaxID=2606717 RepID=A0ACD4NVZ9_9HYPH|nr:hypothetical protein [Antarcticirhabdus aurantiaca]WAJ31195.1 hypothetical protein OXU80_13755 [Jeongeuplla avenae]
MTDKDDLLALVEHNLALLDIEELDEAAPLSRRRQIDRGTVVDKRPDPIAARERRRAWLERLHCDALASAVEASVDENTETTVIQQAKVRG